MQADTKKQADISAEARMHMIAGQIRPNRVSDERVVAAIRAVPREAYVPKALRGIAYIDEDLEVAPGRYLMEPMVFARLIREAEIMPHEVVLDIGCATGYSIAVLARLAETVVAVEEDEALAAKAEETLSAQGVDNAAVVMAPLSKGAPKQGPFDVIILEGAVEVIPQGIIDQLSDGGRLVCVRADEGTSQGYIMTHSGDAVGGRRFCDAFVPALPGFQAERGFEFSL